jgi:hypothetical protein
MNIFFAQKLREKEREKERERESVERFPDSTRLKMRPLRMKIRRPFLAGSGTHSMTMK